MFLMFVTVVLFVLLKTTIGFEEHWEGYKQVYNKSYSADFEARRKQHWEWSAQKVLEHNAGADDGLHSYSLKANHLADMQRKDYLKMVGLSPSRRRRTDPTLLAAPQHSPNDIPEEYDWRKEGFVTPPLDQDTCGSCYAFTIASSIQAQVFKKEKKVIQLSEQQLVDCSVLTGNFGCNGGSFRNTLRYVKLAGLMERQDYPYKAKQSLCKYTRHKVHAKIKNWQVLPARDEYALKVAVATIGPVAVSVNASPYTFQLYHKGIYDDPDCPEDSVNHAMLVVGYTKNAWILQNWWTDNWGTDGYMYMRRGVNRCGISNYAVYVEA